MGTYPRKDMPSNAVCPAHETLENDIEEQDGYCRGYEIPKESESRILVFSEEAFSDKK